MITEELLLQAGYKSYKSSIETADMLYQRTIWIDSDNNAFSFKKVDHTWKKAFFINVYRYDLHKLDPRHKGPSFGSDVRIYTKVNSFDVKLFHEKEYTIEYMEQFYCNMYERNGGIPDIHNND